MAVVLAVAEPAAMAAADARWLAPLLTRRAPLDRCEETLENCDDDVKVAIALAG